MAMQPVSMMMMVEAPAHLHLDVQPLHGPLGWSVAEWDRGCPCLVSRCVKGR